jgi:hypothetical protein
MAKVRAYTEDRGRREYVEFTSHANSFLSIIVTAAEKIEQEYGFKPNVNRISAHVN